MTTLSVFRQQKPMIKIELPVAIQAATTEQDLDVLMKLGMRTDKPVLIGLDAQPSIVKKYVEGDETLSFEALYDTALTVNDLQKMERAGVPSPDAIPREMFHIDLQVGIDCVIDLRLLVAAAEHGEVRRQLRDLHNTDPMFREALHEAIVAGLRRQDVDLVFSTHEITQTGSFLEEGKPTWEFLDRSG